MLMGKVVGHIVSTRKNDKLVGSKILEVRLIENEKDTDKFLIALDSVGAGIGERVLITTGSGARLALDNHTAPTDAVIVGIVD
jgi:ethanolamine utilization protein EutN